jgi:23S rRNA pseudouridine2604 synthase
MKENTQKDAPLFPMRINKYLAQEGRGSRREMDKLIADGKVVINGRRAVLGDKVKDKVDIKFRGDRGERPAHR